MTEQSIPIDKPASNEQTNLLKRGVITQVKQEPDFRVDPEGPELADFLDSGIETIFKIENESADVRKMDDSRIHTDTDVIYIDSGPGTFSKRLQKKWELTDKDGDFDKGDTQYKQYEWSRRMDRDRVMGGVYLAYRVTAKRCGKAVNDLTAQDFAEYGPTIMYTATPLENEIIGKTVEHYQNLGLLKIPDSNIVMYDHIPAEDGKEKTIKHTGEQIEGLRFPLEREGLSKVDMPRRLAIVSQAPHALRILHLLEQNKDNISPDTAVQIVAVPTPAEGFMEYTQKELEGTAASVWKYSPPAASPTPHKYTLK